MQNGDKPLPSITLAVRGLFVKMLITLEPDHIYKRTLKTHHRIFALFLQTLYAIEKLLEVLMCATLLMTSHGYIQHPTYFCTVK